jgi:hypothetical protein
MRYKGDSSMPYRIVMKGSEAKEQLKALKQLKVVDDDLATYLKIVSQDDIKFICTYKSTTAWTTSSVRK